MAREHTAWGGVGFGLAAATLAAYQLFKLPPVLPVLIAAYGYERVLAGALMSVFALCGLLFSLPAGAAVARFGASRLVLVACAFFLAGEAVTLAWAENGFVVLAGRALEGVGFTLCAVVGPLIANLSASRRRLPLVIALTATWIPAGQVVASLVALPLVAAASWRPLWWLGIALTLALALAALLRGRGGATLTPPTTAARTGSMARAERRALIVVGAVFGLWSGQYFGYMTWLPQYLVEVHGLGESLAAFAYTLPVAALLLFNVLTGVALSAGVPLVPLFVGSIVVQVAAWFAVPVVGVGALGTAALLAYGITAGITPVCLFAMPSAVMGPGRLNAGAFGIVMTGRNLGVLIGPVALAAMVEAGGDWSWVWPVFGVVTLAAGLGAAEVGRRLARLGEGAQCPART